LEKLLASAPLQELPPTTLALLGALSEERSIGRLALTALRQGQQLYPADFWINESLAHILAFQMEPPQFEEAIGFHRAALALRPESTGVLLNLGEALRRKGRLDEAIACYRKAIHLKKDFSDAHWDLALALDSQGALDDAIAEYKETIRISPGSINGYCYL